MIEKTGNIINNIGEPIDYTINYNQSDKPSPIFLFLHGFKAFKDWGFYPYLCEKVAEAGFISIRFSFSLSGIADSETMLYDVEKFANNSTAQELTDTDIILDSIINHKFDLPKEIWNGEIIIAGHSKGAALSLLIANRYDQIKKISMIAPVAFLDRYSDRQKELWLQKGAFEFTISKTKQKLRINSSYLEDIIENSEKYSLLKAVNTLNIPLQILHGKRDVTVNIKEPYELAHNYPDKANLRFDIIEKAGHGFFARHPFKGTNDYLEEMIYKLLNFMSLSK